MSCPNWPNIAEFDTLAKRYLGDSASCPCPLTSERKHEPFTRCHHLYTILQSIHVYMYIIRRLILYLAYNIVSRPFSAANEAGLKGLQARTSPRRNPAGVAVGTTMVVFVLVAIGIACIAYRGRIKVLVRRWSQRVTEMSYKSHDVAFVNEDKCETVNIPSIMTESLETEGNDGTPSIGFDCPNYNGELSVNWREIYPMILRLYIKKNCYINFIMYNHHSLAWRVFHPLYIKTGEGRGPGEGGF